MSMQRFPTLDTDNLLFQYTSPCPKNRDLSVSPPKLTSSTKCYNINLITQTPPLAAHQAMGHLQNAYFHTHGSSLWAFTEYLLTLFTVYQPGRSLQSSADAGSLNVSRSHSHWGDRNIQVYGGKAWNSLAADIPGLMSVHCFQTTLENCAIQTCFPTLCPLIVCI